MRIVDYDDCLDKGKVASVSYDICVGANFPVYYQDVYEHLFGEKDSILKLLLDDYGKISGFGVFQNYQLEIEEKSITMLYLSGMVISYKYQKLNLSKEVIKEAYRSFPSDFISLRTQNIAMAMSLFHLYSDNLFTSLENLDFKSLKILRMFEPLYNMQENGIIENCYYTQLYPNLDEMKNYFDIHLGKYDALAVIIEPKLPKRKKLSIFEEKIKKHKR